MAPLQLQVQKVNLTKTYLATFIKWPPFSKHNLNDMRSHWSAPPRPSDKRRRTLARDKHTLGRFPLRGRLAQWGSFASESLTQLSNSLSWLGSPPSLKNLT